MEPKEPKSDISIEVFRAQVPQLTKEAILGRPDKARGARKALINGINNDPLLNSLLPAIETAQSVMLNLSNAQAIKHAVNFMSDLLFQTGNAVAEKGTRIIQLTPQVNQQVRKIKENHILLQRTHYTSQHLPKNYHSMMAGMIPFIERGIASGKHSVGLQFTLPSKPEGLSEEERNQELERLNKWRENINDLFGQAYLSNQQLDELINLVREEPETTILPEKRLFTQRYGQLTLEEIEALPYTLSKDDYIKITDYIIELLKSNPSPEKRRIIEELFLGTKFFAGLTGRIDYRNKELLARLSNWQERLTLSIMYAQEPEIEIQTQQFLQFLNDRETLALISSIYQWATHPFELDPVETEYLTTGKYPLFDEAIFEQSDKSSSEAGQFLYGDEIAEQYFKNVLSLRIKERFEHFAVADRFGKIVDTLMEVMGQHTYEQGHLSAIKSIFEQAVGQEFLDKLSARKGDISKITEQVWQEVSSKMRYLPLQHGVETITLSNNAIAEILLLESVSFATQNPSQEWMTSVSFRLKGTHIRINGALNKEGKLILRAPIDEHIPGLYSILSLISIIGLRDLVIQSEYEEREEPKDRKTRRQSPNSKNQPTEGSLPNARSLPRREQTDRQLIDYVYGARGIPKRRQSAPVGIYKKSLPYSKEYAAAASLYIEGLTSEVSDTTMGWLQQELTEARKKADKYHTSDTKKKTVPARFKLAEVVDPVTGEAKTIETWVVEHKNPKPTEEELKNLPLLYERHYKNSSALALLDQFTPWFIGEE